MAETEKMTINLDVVDLGKIDLLVEQGFYSTRTDLIKTAIRNELSKQDPLVKQMALSKSYIMGISRYTKEDLEKVKSENKMLEIKVIGMLILADDISPELATQTIESIKVMGSFKARKDIKDLFI